VPVFARASRPTTANPQLSRTTYGGHLVACRGQGATFFKKCATPPVPDKYGVPSLRSAPPPLYKNIPWASISQQGRKGIQGE
jgi:hypothetical protein